MNNRQLAVTFTRIANLLEIKGEIIYKTLAYRKASESLMGLRRDASEYWKEGKLHEVPGVGKGFACERQGFILQSQGRKPGLGGTGNAP